MARKKRTDGRPTLLTPELQKGIVRDLEIGTPRTTAAIRAGISYGTFRNWVGRGRKNEEPYLAFLLAIKKAEQDAVLRNLNIIQQVAVGRVISRTTTTDPDGTTHVTEERDEPVWTAAAWFLERRYPEDFGSNRREITELRKQVKDLAEIIVSIPRAGNPTPSENATPQTANPATRSAPKPIAK